MLYNTRKNGEIASTIFCNNERRYYEALALGYYKARTREKLKISLRVFVLMMRRFTVHTVVLR